VVPAAEPVEPVPAPAKSPADWLDHDASVRIVPATKLPPEEPVDADSFVAEVEQLRAMPTVASGRVSAEGEWLDVLDEQEGAAEGAVVSESAATEPDQSDRSEGAEPEEGSPPAGDDVSGDDGPPAEAVAAAPIEPATSEDAAQPEPATSVDAAQPEPAKPDAEGDLDNLFATLRQPAPEPEAESADLEPVVAEEIANVTGTRIDAAGHEDEEPVSAVGSAAVVDPFDLKERMLLPIENRALRSVKRRIVDLQNRVLEELRLGDEEWQPDRALFAASIGDEVAVLTQESYVAGYAAAADLVGDAATPPPDHAADQETTAEFVDAVLAATNEALDRARATGGGTRQVSAAVSRVFRAWRTDEAERRLRRLGARAYHSGILDAMPGLGVTDVIAVAEGIPCGACPAGTGAVWRPSDGLPEGTALPPAVPGCTATIVPATVG
jgi:hypothetical protein